MPIVLLVARLLLALVFFVAGVAKLTDRPGSRQPIVAFGVPAAFAPALGILRPLAELAVAAALMWQGYKRAAHDIHKKFVRIIDSSSFYR